MLKPNRQIFLIAVAICSGVSQPVFSETVPAAVSQPERHISNETQAPQASTIQQSQNASPTAPFKHETAGTAPTLGEVLDQEAKQQAQNGPVGYPPGSPIQGSSGPAPNAPVCPQNSPGYVPNRYPASAYPGGGIRSGVGNILNEVRGMVQNMVQVNPGSENVKVRVPFVNVDVNHGQPNVKVNAPFVKVDKTPDAPVSVNAPFVNVSNTAK